MRYVIVTVVQDISGDPNDYYLVVDNGDGATSPKAIARVDTITTAITIRDLLNASVAA